MSQQLTQSDGEAQHKNPDAISVAEVAEDHDIPRWKVVKMANDLKHADEVRAGSYYYRNLDPDAENTRRTSMGGHVPETPGPLPRNGDPLSIEPQ